MTIWSELADMEFKLYYLNANGVKTRVLEAGTVSPLFCCMVRGILRLMQETSRGLSEKFRVICMICLDMDIPQTKSTIWD